MSLNIRGNRRHSSCIPRAREGRTRHQNDLSCTRHVRLSEWTTLPTFIPPTYIFLFRHRYGLRRKMYLFRSTCLREDVGESHLAGCLTSFACSWRRRGYGIVLSTSAYSREVFHVKFVEWRESRRDGTYRTTTFKVCHRCWYHTVDSTAKDNAAVSVRVLSLPLEKEDGYSKYLNLFSA